MAVIAEIEVKQVRQLKQGRDVLDAVEEQLKIDQLLEVGKRGDVGDVVVGENECVQVLEVSDFADVVDGHMTEIERPQLGAVPEERGEVRAVAGSSIIGGERGKDLNIGSDGIGQKADGPDKADLGILLPQALHQLVAQPASAHFDGAELREKLERLAERVKGSDVNVVEIKQHGGAVERHAVHTGGTENLRVRIVLGRITDGSKQGVVDHGIGSGELIQRSEKPDGVRVVF